MLTILRRWPVGNGGWLTLAARRINPWIGLRRIVKCACHHPSVSGVAFDQLVVPADGYDSPAFQKGDAISVV